MKHSAVFVIVEEGNWCVLWPDFVALKAQALLGWDHSTTTLTTTWMCLVAFNDVALFDGVMNDSSPLHELKRSGELIQLFRFISTYCSRSGI